MSTDKQKRILFVDDDDTVREIVDAILEGLGYAQVGASSGDAALELLKTEKFDLILSDVQMPGCDGVQMLRKIRQTYGTDTPVVLMSGYSDIPIWKMLDFGANSFIGKPFDMMQLSSVLETNLMTYTQRWAKALEEPAKTEIQLTFDSMESINSPTGVAFGRGGIFVGIVRTDLMRGRTVSLNLQLPQKAGGLVLKGSGIIRWARASPADGQPPGIGIEFTHLDRDSQKFVIALAEKRGVTSFIPVGPNTHPSANSEVSSKTADSVVAKKSA